MAFESDDRNKILYIFGNIFTCWSATSTTSEKRKSYYRVVLFTCFLLNKGGIDEEPNVPYVTANCGRKDAQLIMTDLSSAGYCFNSTSSVVRCACQSL